ncbi:hypothetical protein Tco_0069986, partial [Tanacetum coccineum]
YTPALAANSEVNVLAEWKALYDAYNEVACLMLGTMWSNWNVLDMCSHRILVLV